MVDESYVTLAMQVHDLVGTVPLSVSGNNLLAVIDRARITVRTSTGLDPGSPYIAERFRPAVMATVLGRVWNAKVGEGIGKSVRIGDFSVGAGPGESSASSNASRYTKEAQDEIDLIGRGTRYGRTY